MVRRYGLVSLSSAASSVAHLVVQLVAIRTLAPAGIGLLAFLITLIQFGFGLSNALVAAPYTILVNRAVGRDDGAVASLLAVNLGLSFAWGLVCLAVAALGGGGWTAGVAFGIAAALQLVRWFARSDAFAHHRPQRAAISDAIYAVALLAAVAVMALGPGIAFAGIAAAFALASAVALLPFGIAAVVRIVGADPRVVGGYRAIWRSQSRWALVGVATTEATANGHSYLVTALCGPAAFAPIAVGALFLRPLSVCVTALTQVERPRMARDVDAGDGGAALRSARHFAMALGLVWLGTIVLAAAILLLAPQLVVKPSLDRGAVVAAVLLGAGVAAIQCLQTPPNVLLQAADRFRGLAMASLRSCGVTLILAGGLLLVVAPVWSLAGVAAGQAVMLFEIVRAVRRWRVDEVRR